jgi:DNA-binding NarL/FixJ family response regulator
MHTNQLKILLVDDSSIILQRVQQLLHESLSIERIMIAFDGEDAIEAVSRFQPDIMLLDISMPRKNGMEVLKHVKLNYSGIKVVMLTSQPADQYKDLCMEYGASAYIDKTNEFETVPTVILDVLGKE